MASGVRALIVLLAMAAAFGSATAQAQTVDLALVLAVDVSRSIDDDEFQLQRRGYADAFRNPAVITAIRGTPHGTIAVTFVEWAGAEFQRVVVPWTVISDAESGQIFAESVQREPRSFYGWTSISGAIDYAVRLIETSPYREGTMRRVIDVSGDGVNNSGRPAAAARDAAIARGIAINGLVIMNDSPNPGFGSAFQPALDQFYRDNVIGGQGAFVIAVDDFESFAYAILNKLIREISALPPDSRLAGLERPSIRIATPGSAFFPARRTIRAADASFDEPDETGYLAADGFVEELVAELNGVTAVHERLVLAQGGPQPAAWAQNVWLAPRRIPIASIGDAARSLRGLQRNWAFYATGFHRRAALIEAKLPPFRPKPLVFPKPPPTAPIGSWTLLTADMVLAAPTCTSPFRHGEAHFEENREAPPNRAYLKLWEALTRLGTHPRAGERCIDLGASPGGWTWVLAELGTSVIAVDKAPLDARLDGHPRIEYRRQSAFAIDPQAIEPFDWMFCDVACYPRRLLDLVQRWIAAKAARRIVATVKFQGPTDLEIQREFSAIPNATLQHLFHNKHELTWIWTRI